MLFLYGWTWSQFKVLCFSFYSINFIININILAKMNTDTFFGSSASVLLAYSWHASHHSGVCSKFIEGCVWKFASYIFTLAVLGLRAARGLPLAVGSGAPLRCGSGLCPCGSFSRWAAQAPGQAGAAAVLMALAALWRVGLWARHPACVPCIDRRVLNHSATKEVQNNFPF